MGAGWFTFVTFGLSLSTCFTSLKKRGSICNGPQRYTIKWDLLELHESLSFGSWAVVYVAVANMVLSMELDQGDHMVLHCMVVRVHLHMEVRVDLVLERARNVGALA